MRTAVIAFGGNAFLPLGASGAYEEQAATIEDMAQVVGDVRAEGYRVLVTHGNGPQVGNLAIQQEDAAGHVPAQPLFALDAMTQGQLGHLLAVGIRNRLGDRPTVCALVTHVVVESDDPAFAEPTKPIGPYYTPAQAEQAARDRDWAMRAVSPDHLRRVVPSPAPVRVLETDGIHALLAAGQLVVAGGGGGIPVLERDDGRLRGVDAVVDKDRVAQAMATAVDAELLVLVTGVPGVAIDYGTRQERLVEEMTAGDARRHLADGQFPAGSMGPKVESAIAFLDAGGAQVVITSRPFVTEAILGRHGTRIVSSPARRTREPVA
jgi:carbamate kinase